MSTLYDIGDTIAAISTPAGMGGIGIVRLSGMDAFKIADKMFVTKKGISPSACTTYTVHYGDVVRRKDDGYEVVDEALLTVMKAPRSYTCEDVVEISCHGGSAAVNAIFKIVLELGARMSGPGEFTKRAFLNGRIDLAQAEAVLDVIRAKTEAGLSVSEHQLKGELTQCLEKIRQELMDVYVRIEAEVNFPDESQEGVDHRETQEVLGDIQEKVRLLLSNADQGRILREGIKVVLCGKPNVGKSSLMNVLLRQPRAIVSRIEGTTRDAIEESAQISGIPFQMVDTAGILSPRDEIEEEAVKRSHLHIEDADLVLFLLDASRPLNDQDFQLAEKVKAQNVLIVLNKEDLDSAIDEKEIRSLISGVDIYRVSALQKQGIQELQDAILRQILHGKCLEPQNIILSNVRHIDLLKKCLGEIQAIGSDLSSEFSSEHIKRAVQELDRITGRDVDVDLVDQIFSEFCIGK